MKELRQSKVGGNLTRGFAFPNPDVCGFFASPGRPRYRDA
jgi:hypothetical protein